MVATGYSRGGVLSADASLAWYLAIHLGKGTHGLIYAIIAGSAVSVVLLIARFWLISRRQAAIGLAT